MNKSIFGIACGIALAGAASATPLYETGFEPPVYFAGGIVDGIDGWSNGSGSGNSHIISTMQAIDTQSLAFDNSGTFNSFYSVRRELPFGIEDGFAVSVRLYMDGFTEENRLYGLYLVSTPTSTLGGTTLGLTIGGDGAVRAGTTWGNTYTNSGLIGFADFGTFKDRWLTITLIWQPDGNAVASISGFDGPNDTISVNLFQENQPLGLNIGADWFTTSLRAGTGYFDDLEITTGAGPTCPPDLNGDGVVDADDFFLFLNLFATGDMRADFNNDGVIDADDFFLFLNLFAAGC